jgi:hypothetical protein
MVARRKQHILFLYLFTNIKPDEVVDRAKKYELIVISSEGRKYLGVITDKHANEKIGDIIDDLTVLRGFDCVAGMKHLKNLLINEVIEPLSNPEIPSVFGIPISKRLLLWYM